MDLGIAGRKALVLGGTQGLVVKELYPDMALSQNLAGLAVFSNDMFAQNGMIREDAAWCTTCT